MIRAQTETKAPETKVLIAGVKAASLACCQDAAGLSGELPPLCSGPSPRQHTGDEGHVGWSFSSSSCR